MESDMNGANLRGIWDVSLAPDFADFRGLQK